MLRKFKSVHSRRRSDLASWPRYDSLFGCGLAGDNGDVDALVECGTQKLFGIIRHRILVELGLREDYITEIQIKGVVGSSKYGDHAVVFDTHVSLEAERILREKVSTHL